MSAAKTILWVLLFSPPKNCVDSKSFIPYAHRWASAPKRVPIKSMKVEMNQTKEHDQRITSGRYDIAKIAAAVLISGVGVTSGIAVGGILAETLAGTAAAGGLAQTFTILGAGLSAIPLAMIARKHGRRIALITGYLIASIGAITILIGGQSQNLVVMLIGMLFYGSSTATSLQARFVATEYTVSRNAAKAMSFVIWGSTIGSVVGPNLTNVANLFGRSIGLHSLIGPYIFSLSSFFIAIAIISFLKPSRLPSHSEADSTSTRKLPTLPEALRSTLSSRVSLFALATVIGGQMMMSAVMVMTPVSMHNHGFDLQIIGFVLSSHIFGMYALSPVFGWIADRWGAMRVCWLGIILFTLALSTGVWDATDPHHSNTVRLTAALVMLGLGWCATLIGGSTLLTRSLHKDTRVAIQGSSDAMMNFGAAGLAALAGPILEFGGFFAVNVMASVVLFLVLIPLGLRAASKSALQELAAKRLEETRAEAEAEAAREVLSASTKVDKSE